MKSTKSKKFVPETPSTFTALTAKDAHYTESKVNTPPKDTQGMGDQRLNTPTKKTKKRKGKTTSNDTTWNYDDDPKRKDSSFVVAEPQFDIGQFGDVAGRTKRKRGSEFKVPFWLVEFGHEHLSVMKAIKTIFQTERDDQKVLAKLGKVIKMVTPLEICQILKITPKSVNGNFSFKHFMFIAGNPTFAKKNVNYPTNKYVKLNCKKLSKSKENCDKNSNCTAGFREAFFYTALLLFEMHDTLTNLENIYLNENWISPTPSKPEPNQKNRATDKKIGIGLAAWELPPIPKISPYLTSHPFVTNRWEVQKPNADEQGRRRTKATLRPMHLMVEPPKEPARDPIKITENRIRIRNALRHLAAQGDVVSLLPDVQYLIHLSGTFVDKLEETYSRATATPRKKEVHHHEDITWIAREIKAVYTPHGLPKQINKLSHNIKFTDAIKLRKICESIRANQWAYVSNKKLAFREKAWEKMRVDYMPEGLLKSGFINSFVTLLPHISHLPIVHQRAHPTPM